MIFLVHQNNSVTLSQQLPFASNTGLIMEYLPTRSGTQCLFYGGFRYTKRRDNKSGESLWCCLGKKRRCRGRVTIKNDKIVRQAGHSCVSSPDSDQANVDLLVSKAVFRAKKRARDEIETSIFQVGQLRSVYIVMVIVA